LTTPYQLTGAGCNQAVIGMSRFVHAVILNTDTGDVALYNPLVITAGLTPLVPPVPINFTVNNHVVGIWIGSNSNTLTLSNPNGIVNGRCVFGTPGSPFGQLAFCNVDAFWKAVEFVRVQGNLPVPPTGVAVDGMACPTVRDYFVVDMDPDDGVPTTYLLTADGNVVQKTLNNMKNLNIAGELANDGDHRLVSSFVQGALGCQGWIVADLADPGVKRSALPMNVLQAHYYQPMPIEVLPNNDPMTTTGGFPDLMKLNLYKRGIYQQQINNLIEADPAVFCRAFLNITAPRLKTLAPILKNNAGPAAGQTLFDFMKARASATYAAINCLGLIGVPDPFVNIMKNSADVPFRREVIEEFDLEEYRNGGFDDGLKYRSYRFGAYWQETNPYE
jgi:hypothetical protein